MNVTLRQLRAFSAVARTKSFTQAANMLHVTQPALSLIINVLESQLGVCLIDRHAAGNRLSKIGEEFYPLVSRILSDIDRALNDINDLKLLERGTLRMAVPQVMASTLIPRIIGRFRADYGKIHVDVIDCPVEEVSNRILYGDAEIGIGPFQNETQDLRADLLFEQTFRLAASEGCDLLSKKRINWRDLEGYPMIIMGGQFANQLILDVHELIGKPISYSIQEVSFMSTAFGLVESGAGVTVYLPYASALVKMHNLQTRKIYPDLKNRFYIYSDKNRDLSPASKKFSEYAHSYMSGCSEPGLSSS